MSEFPIQTTKHSSLGNIFLVCHWGDIHADPDKIIYDRYNDFFERLRAQGKWGKDVDGLVLGQLKRPGEEEKDGLHEIFVARIFNADGSEAEISGNGLCCLGQARALLELADPISVLHAGLKSRVRLNEILSSDRHLVEVDIPYPKIGSETILKAAELAVEIAYRRIAFVDVGNPHIVVRVDNLEEVNEYYSGRAIERQFGPVNVEFIQVNASENTIKMKVWERGVGVTRSCGSGAIAAVAACREWGVLKKLGGKGVSVFMSGGKAQISLVPKNSENEPDYLRYMSIVRYLGKYESI